MSYFVRPFQIESVAPPKDWDSFHWPHSFVSALNGETPLDLEIGCGVGWHPIRYAIENPDRRLIAIEHTREKFESFKTRVKAHQDTKRDLSNLLPIHADAVRWVTHGLKPNSIDHCYILYPNPEPKAENKRWFRMPFMSRLLETLKPGGQITLATNEEKYWREALEWAAHAWKLKIIGQREFKASDCLPGLPRTHFEKKYLARGETCFDLTVAKPV